MNKSLTLYRLICAWQFMAGQSLKVADFAECCSEEDLQLAEDFLRRFAGWSLDQKVQYPKLETLSKNITNTLNGNLTETK